MVSAEWESGAEPAVGSRDIVLGQWVVEALREATPEADEIL